MNGSDLDLCNENGSILDLCETKQYVYSLSVNFYWMFTFCLVENSNINMF